MTLKANIKEFGKVDYYVEEHLTFLYFNIHQNECK